MIRLSNGNKFITKSMQSTLSVRKILHFISTIITEDFVDVAEKHNFWEIVYLESGEAIVEADERRETLFAGDLYFHKPGEVHSIKAVNGQICVFFISFDSTSKAMTLFDGLKLALSSEEKRLIRKIYAEARNIFERGERSSDPDAFVSKSLLPSSPLGSQQLYKLYIEELLLLCAREAEKNKSVVTYDSKEKLERMIIEEIVTLMSESLYSTLSVEDICKSLNYSRTYLSTLFKQHRKTSLIDYYNSLKIKEAKKLLLKKSVFEVSSLLNFSNPYYFSRVFKKYEKISPTEYKKISKKI